MTREEFIELKEHARIKYVGTDAAVLKELKRESKSAQTKGLVVSSTQDREKNSWSKGEGLGLYTWSGSNFVNCKPEDWVIVDARRIDLTRTREKRAVQRTDKWVRNELALFSKEFTGLKSRKENIDSWLDDVPLPARLKILTSLTEEEKIWLQLIAMDPKDVIEKLKRIVTDEEVEDGSNGQDVPVSPEATICTSQVGSIL